MNCGAANPLKARKIRDMDNGGAVFEVPVLTEQTQVDFSKSHGGGPTSGSVTASDMREMVSNFDSWPKRPTVGFDGIDLGHDRDKAGPSAAFVNALRFDEGVLWATIEADSFGASLVARYGGTSVEAQMNPSITMGDFDGWVMTGFIFTNDNAIDTAYRIAASESFQAARALISRPEGEEMANEKETARELELAGKVREQGETIKVLREQITAKADTSGTSAEERTRLLRENADLTDKSVTLRAKVGSLESEAVQLRGKIDAQDRTIQSLTADVAAEVSKTKAVEIRELAEKAIANNFPATYFEGLDADPVAWFNENYGETGTLDALRKLSETKFQTGSKNSPTSSGTDKTPPDAGESEAIQLTDKQKKALRTAGVTEERIAAIESGAVEE